MSGILGTKVGMSQIFNEKGERVPVTLISTEGRIVVQKKTVDKDGYNAVQLGVGKKSAHKVSSVIRKHFEKANAKPTRWVREIRLDDVSPYELGKEVPLDFLIPGVLVNIRGTTKGRGFAGAIKRWNFSGGPMNKGSTFHRRVGSIGNHTFPKRVFKGRPMPGHYGVDQQTVRNIELIDVLRDEKIVVLKGSIPGSKNSLVEIRLAKSVTPKKEE